MGLSFLTPLFFAGLAALLIPVLIHLVHRPNPQGMAFPSLMFLRQIEYRERRRLRIHHWWLLALRCLAIALLVLAFAQPFFKQADVASSLISERRDVVILLDHSYSMGYGDHWQRAQQQAQTTIAELADNDRAALIAFDHSAVVLSELTTEHQLLQELLLTQQISAADTDYATALEQASRLLSASDAPQRQVVLISDLQASALAATRELLLAEELQLVILPVQTEQTANAAIVNANLAQPEQESDKMTVTARIRNTANQTLAQREISLTVDGSEIDRQAVPELAVGHNHEVIFTVVPPRDRAVQATLSLSADELTIDDAFHLVLKPARPLPVLVIEHGQAGASRAQFNKSLFFQQSLALSEQPRIEVTVKQLSDLQADDLAAYALIIINDAPLPGGELGESLKQFVNDGGGLFIAAGNGVQGGWPGGSDGYLPGILGRRVENIVSLSQLDFDHPVFELFNRPENGHFGAAQITAYRRLSATNDNDQQVLARYSDNSEAVLERSVGSGKVIALNSTLDTSWNDIVLQPAFLPFIHQLARYLTGYEVTPAWYSVTAIIDTVAYARATGYPLAANQLNVVEAPSGRQIRLTTDKPLFTVTEAGVYEIHAPNGAIDSLLVAANIDAQEAELAVLSESEFRGRLNRITQLTPALASTDSDISINESSQQQQRLWWYLLLAALIAFAVETLLSNRLSRSNDPVTA